MSRHRQFWNININQSRSSDSQWTGAILYRSRYVTRKHIVRWIPNWIENWWSPCPAFNAPYEWNSYWVQCLGRFIRRSRRSRLPGPAVRIASWHVTSLAQWVCVCYNPRYYRKTIDWIQLELERSSEDLNTTFYWTKFSDVRKELSVK